MTIKKKLGIVNFASHSSSNSFMSPEEIISKLRVKQGNTIVDLGAGAGYWVIVLAKKVGDYGKVYALEIKPELIDLISKKAKEEGLDNVETVSFNLEKDSDIPIKEKVDLVIIANMLPFLKNKDNILKHACGILKKEGRIVVVDWDKEGLPIGPPIASRLSREETIKAAEKQKLVLKESIDAGIYHYGLIFTKK